MMLDVLLLAVMTTMLIMFSPKHLPCIFNLAPIIRHCLHLYLVNQPLLPEGSAKAIGVQCCHYVISLLQNPSRVQLVRDQQIGIYHKLNLQGIAGDPVNCVELGDAFRQQRMNRRLEGRPKAVKQPVVAGRRELGEELHVALMWAVGSFEPDVEHVGQPEPPLQ
ncbi:hypothetical protein COO60DRAFT_1530204 [Scenedesmus sp. NREL 46B-D3]|nr:hypothetical protein COO60DRAFT_1530204 [Scenedesmus sp. NREL 46B-D3]